MPFESIAQVNISLETTPLTRAGFGVPLFIGSHTWFRERIRAYTSVEAAAADFPTTSNEYKAVEKVFSQSPAPSVVKIGRRTSDAVLTPATPSDGLVYGVVVEVNDGDSVTVSVTASAIDTEETIVDAIKAAIDANAAVVAHISATKNGTGSTTTLTLSATTAADQLAISGLGNLSYSFTTAETAAAVLTAVEAEDGDFYFVTSNDHTETFVLAMAAAIEAKSKQYFVSLGEAGGLDVLATPATDIAGKLKELNYARTVWMFHKDADTTFPEMGYVGRFAWTDPGSHAWTHKVISGVSASKDPATGYLLSATQKNNVAARNGNIIESNYGVDIVRDGKVVFGEWIDVIRSRDFLEARIAEAIFNLKLNSPKIPYDSTGRAKILATVESELNRYITTPSRPNILDSANPYTTDFPAVADVSAIDKANRVYTASFTAYLSGAIIVTKISGVLTYNVG